MFVFLLVFMYNFVFFGLKVVFFFLVIVEGQVIVSGSEGNGGVGREVEDVVWFSDDRLVGFVGDGVIVFEDDFYFVIFVGIGQRFVFFEVEQVGGNGFVGVGFVVGEDIVEVGVVVGEEGDVEGGLGLGEVFYGSYFWW